MPFKKSNKLYEENVLIRDTVQDKTKEELCLIALLYVEYRLRYYKAAQEKVSSQCVLAASLFYEAISGHALFEDEFFGMPDFSHRLRCLSRRKGWVSLECVINDMDLVSGLTGGMVYQRKTEIIGIFKIVLEQYYEFPLTKIIKEVRSK